LWGGGGGGGAGVEGCADVVFENDAARRCRRRSVAKRFDCCSAISEAAGMTGMRMYLHAHVVKSAPEYASKIRLHDGGAFTESRESFPRADPNVTSRSVRGAQGPRAVVDGSSRTAACTFFFLIKRGRRRARSIPVAAPARRFHRRRCGRFAGAVAMWPRPSTCVDIASRRLASRAEAVL